MDYSLTKEQKMVQQLAREFAQKEVKPLAEEIDEEERFPVESAQKMFKLGFYGGPFPEEIGGQGGDFISYSICIEELAKVCATTAVVLSVHALGISVLSKFGNPAQIEKYMPRLMNKDITCFCLTEAGAGSDAAGVKTKAVKDGDYWVLNGTKMFITNAGYAGLYFILANTDKTKKNNGMTCFIVEADNLGLRIGKKERKCGIRGSSTCEVILENCRVHKDDILGQEGKGLSIALSSLDGGRLGIASQALGISQGALDEAMKYVKERKQFGKRISQFQKTQFSIADMHARVEATRMLVRKAAYLKQVGDKEAGVTAAMAKLFASDTANIVTRECVQLMGGYGYTREYPVERMFRDAKITEIYEGTSEVQRMVISRNLGIN